MRQRFVIMMVVFIIFFGLVNGYVGLRSWQWVHAWAPHFHSAGFWIPFWLLVYSFLIGRFSAPYLPRRLVNLLTVIGAYWLAIFQYAIPILLIIDFARLLNRKIGYIPEKILQDVLTLQKVGGVVFLLVLCILLYGVWHARNPIVVSYDVTIPKNGGKHNELYVVMVSDTHVGTINGVRRLQHMVKMVNELEPDLILLVGDLLDDDFYPFIAERMADQLQTLKSKLGTYAVLGNHDYSAGHLDEFQAELEQAGIRLLVDETLQIDDSFYVIGRDDLSGKSYHGRARKPLHELLQGLGQDKPFILMDHQPYRLEEAQKSGIDLQVSGHTHRGQTYPYHYITRKIYELDWGYLKKESTHIIVSSGFGTWGPPIRLGNRPEVVSVKLRFTGTGGGGG